MSVSDITPVSRPEIPVVPDTTGNDDVRAGEAGDEPYGATRTAGVVAGVAGAEGDGEDPSTTHILCAFVATSFAVVCASVEYGLTWNTGNESFPFSTPLSESMTEIKCKQDDFKSGRLLVLVRCLTSTVEIFPTTLKALSTTATLVRPSSLINRSASVKGLSPLESLV
jgi:hypothetical protein